MYEPQPCIVAYDIASHRTRRRVLRVLREWRLDGQKSVHECRLTPIQAEELFVQLAEAIDSATDHLLLAWVQTRRRGLARGQGRVLVAGRIRLFGPRNIRR
ncbi:MAG: CRISPR-associated endonuclease Cas2 [Gammaproteobacteria bacterium]|nr:MAG: CRISPR-associated endonuclease Cas2 [Gammaproteobacteria bacterium]